MKTLLFFTFFLLFSATGYAEDRCRSWRLPPSHLLYFRDMEAVRLEFSQKSQPHASVRIHFGRCELQRYIEVRSSVGFWSELSERTVGFSEVCTSEVPCRPAQRAFLEAIDTLQKRSSSKQVYRFSWEKSPSAFGFFFCSDKQGDLFFQCSLVRPGKRTPVLDIIEKKSLKLYDIYGLPEDVFAVGMEGFLRKDGSRFELLGRQPVSWESSALCRSMPEPLPRYAQAFFSLQKAVGIRLVSLLALSKAAWHGELGLLSQPRLWLFRPNCQR